MLMKQLYPPHSLSLLTDLYQLTMAYGYWKTGIHHRQAVFHHFFRKLPFKGNYAIAAGLEQVIDWVQGLRFTSEDLNYLSNLKGNNQQPLFSQTFLAYLKDFRFEGDIDAITEGTVVFPHEPLIRVKGRLIECQLLETALLNLVNFQTLIATKSARICLAAKGDNVLEFGLRRAHGVDGGLSASRAAYIGGCVGTSNVLAGKILGIPIKGTHAHSWVMSFDTEMAAFEAYAEAMPNNCIFLVDTYDTVEGVKKAIQVGRKLRENGHEMLGIRLDSGDMAALSIAARQLLDDAGFPDAKIVASDSLDEYKIKALKEKGAKIDLWGVGTRLVTAYEQAALGGVYKLAALWEEESKEWDYKIKLSEQAIKTSNPGILQVDRYYNEEGQAIGDIIVNEEGEYSHTMIEFASQKTISLEATKPETLLKPIFRAGELVYKCPELSAIRQHTLDQLQIFSNAFPYATGLEANLHQLKQDCIAKMRGTSVSKVDAI